MVEVIHDGRGPKWADPAGDEGVLDEIGVRITRDMVGEAADPGRGDVYGNDQRVSAFDRAQELRHRALLWRKHNNRPPERDFGAWFISGEKGDGKSVYVSGHMYGAYILGYACISNASLLIGHRFSEADMVQIGDYELSNYYLFWDEIHATVERMGANAWSHRLFRNSGALQRKDSVRAFYASVEEDQVGLAVLKLCSWLKYPGFWAPDAVRRVGDRTVFVPRHKRRKKPTFPWFCYVKARRLGPWPYKARRMIDEYLPEHLRHRSSLSGENHVAPVIYHESTKLLDTWEKPSIAAAMDMTAASLRKSRQEREEAIEQAMPEGADLVDALREALHSGALDTNARSIPSEHLLFAAAQHGFEGDLDEVKMITRGLNILNTKNWAPTEKLVAFLS